MLRSLVAPRQCYISGAEKIKTLLQWFLTLNAWWTPKIINGLRVPQNYPNRRNEDANNGILLYLHGLY